MRRSTRLIGTAVAVVGALSIAGGVAASSTVVVRPGDVAAGYPPSSGGQTWFAADTRTGGSVSLVTGPATPPLGTGSIQMTTADYLAKAQLLNYGYIGTPLASFDAISYSAYRSSSSTNNEAQTIALNLEVDFNGPSAPGGFTTFVFEPVYQPGGVGAMKTDTWQTWDAYNGGNAIWWSTKVIPGAPHSVDSFVTWSSLLEANPDATIVGGVGFDVGWGWAGQSTGYADALKIGVSGNTTVYDFEANAPLMVTAPDATRAQGDADPAFVPTYAGFVYGDTAASLTTQPSCTTTATTSSPVGTYPITCLGGVSDNYTFTYVPGTLNVTAAAPTVEPTEIVGGATGTPARAATLPPTSASGNSSSGGDSTPISALLICLAFGSLGLMAVEVQRRSIRR